MKKDFMTIIYIDMISLQNVSAYEELITKNEHKFIPMAAAIRFLTSCESSCV